MGYFGIPFRNGVPIGLGSVASFGAQQFDPSSLFIGGTAGTWYDPSDSTTLFTTSTGTTPCAVPGSGSQVLVGLMLDKSQGAPGALGAELVTTPYSGSTSGTWAISSTSVTRNSSTGGQATLILIGAISTSKWYLVSFTVANLSGDTFFYRVGGGGTAYQITANGVYTARVLGGGTASSLVFAPWAGGAGEATITNISVREIPGNHAIAFNDTTARPELSARVNLLTYSEQFENAAWTKTVSTVTANTQIAPNGTLTADTLTASIGGGFHYINTPVTTQAIDYIYNVWVKKGTSRWIFVGILDSRLNYFDLDTGLFGSVTDSCTAQNVGDGWYRLSITGTTPASSSGGASIGVASGNNVGNFVANGTETVHIWGADLRPTNIGSAIPSYQRIADQYTYDSNGFPSYLRFDGVDDSMYTPASINFSGTDKMSVFAGVRKLSDAARAMLTELSATTSNPGTFSIEAPAAAAARFDFYSTGTVGASANAVGAAYAAPITAVLTGVSDILAPVATLRINGTQAATNTTSQGTGNYGTYPLFIGSRNNANLRFNGHLYSLIIAGTQLQSGSITATEQYVAGKTGVQI